MKILKRIYHAAAAAYIPCVLIVPAILNGILGGGGILPDSYMLTLLTVLMHSFPLWLSLTWLCAVLCRFAERGNESTRDKSSRDKGSGDISSHGKIEHGKAVGKLSLPIDIACALASAATVVAGIFSVTIALALSAVLCLLWIEDAIFTRRPLIVIALLKDKAVWLIAVVLTVAVLAGAGICASSAKGRNVPDTVELNAAVTSEYQSAL